MKTQIIRSKDAAWQKLEVLKTNRNKRYRYFEFLVEGVRNLNEALRYGWTFSSLIYPSGTPLSDWAKDMLKKTPTEVNLELTPVEPPEILYHGTAERFLDSISEKGLLPMSRQYVHLSGDEETAYKVGKRHGKPYILKIKSGEMHRQGYSFYLSENHVWLTEKVPPVFLI